MKKHNETNRLFELLISDKNSPLYHFKNNIPNDNLSYLMHWFEYFDFINSDKNTVADLIDSNDIGIEAKEFETHYELRNKLIRYIEACHKDVLSKLEFEPRLDQYVKLFPAEEQRSVKLLIIANLYINIHKEESYNSLLGFANDFDIDKEFIFSLNESHRLFRDKIIELKTTDSYDNNPISERNIYFNFTVYFIFAGLDVKPEELVLLKESTVIQLFKLADPDQLLAFSNNCIEEVDNELYSDGSEGVDIEGLFDDEYEDLDEPENEETLKVLNEENNNNDREYYKNNLDYLFHEDTYYKSLVALKEKQKDLERGDLEEERKIHLMEQKTLKQRYLCDLKLENSIKQGFVPKLEKISKKINLNSFEINVLKILVTARIFIDPGNRYSSNNTLTVKEVILLLIDDQVQQILAKKYFQKNAKLIKSGLVNINQSRDSLNTSLFDGDLVVDNRLLDYLTGEEFDITDHIEGSFFYKSAIKIESVKIPDELKDRVLSTIDNFPAFLKTKKKLGFSDIVEYGNALVMLFVGKSGTGKTMFANAIANYLDKKVLLFDLNSFSQMNYSQEDRQLFSVLFREARMNNAILFFDEAEDLLEDRYNDLLIEIEKHEGIVVFATNATFEIDEAMRRRINLILNLPSPGPMIRKDIWKSHFPENIILAEDVDLEQIARRFELNGGLIKNAVFSSLAQAVNTSNAEPLKLKMSDIEYGAKEQLHNKLFMSNSEKHKVPAIDLDKIVLPQKMDAKINEVINIEKSRNFIETEWGFGEEFSENKGITLLLHGPSGTGKTITAEAIAYEMGRKLKIVNYSQVISMFVGGTEKELETLFEEVADSESILLFDEADALFARRTGVAGSLDRYANTETDVLLSLIERYNAFTILTTNFISNIDHAFFRRMTYIIEFKNPGEKERIKLWNTLIPAKMPLSSDVNLEALAEKYNFTGGDIRNSITRVATKKAIKMEKNIKVSQNDLISICDEISNNKNIGDVGIGFKK
jgi:SpoVK/Ycf46/Vps4 family AAA+-type ATPase